MFTPSWIRKVSRESKRRHRRALRRRRRETITPFLAATILEERRVLSAAPAMELAQALAIDAGVDANDGNPDVFQVSVVEQDGQERLEVSVNDRLSFAGPLSDRTTLSIEGSSDNDFVNVEFSGDAPFTLDTLAIDGGQGGFDQLTLSGATADSVLHNLAGPSHGQIVLGGDGSSTSIGYTGIESISDLTAADQRVFQLGGESSSIVISDDAQTGNGISLLDPGTGAITQFVAPDRQLEVHANATTSERIELRGLDSEFDADFTLNAQSDDTVHVTGDVSLGTGDLSLVAGEISHEGTISASGGTVQLDAGDGVLSITGTIDVSDTTLGNTGGTIHLLGEQVALHGNADIDASGDAGGGEVLIGGDYQGANPDIHNAVRTYVGSDVIIAANALTRGDGGKVIVWADDATHFHGAISARGNQDGDGGFVEVSGGISLAADGSYDLSAPRGRAGTLLFDPLNIQIVGGSSDGSDDTDASAVSLINDSGSNTLGSILFADEGAGSPNPFLIYESEIEGTNANIILEARGNITVSGDFASDDVVLQNNRSLTLRTRNNGTDGAGGIDLTGSTDGNNLEFRTQGTGTITIQASTDGTSTGNITVAKLTTANRSIALDTNNGSVAINNIVSTGAGAGDVGVAATTGITLADVANLISAGTGAVALGTQGGAITVNGISDNAEIATTGAVSLTADSVGSATNHLDISGATALAVVDTGAGAIYIDEVTASTIAATSITVADSTSGTIDIAYFNPGAGGNVVDIDNGHTIASVDLSNNTQSSFAYTATAGSISLADGAINTGARDVALSAAGTIDESTNADTVNVTTTGTLTLNSGGAIGAAGGTEPVDVQVGTLVAHALATGGIYIKNTGGVVLLDVDTLSGDISISSTGAVTATAVDANSDVTISGTNVALGAVTASAGGTVSVTATTGNITDAVPDAAADITTTGTVNLTAAGSIGATGANGAVDVATVTQLNVDANDDLIVNGDGATVLTGLAVTLDPSGAATYDLTNFSGLTENIATDATDLTVTNYDSSNATNLSLKADSGDIGVISFDTTGAGTLTLTGIANITVANGGMQAVAGSVNVSTNGGAILAGEASDGTANVLTTGGAIQLNSSTGIRDSGTDGFDIDSGGGAVDLSRTGNGLLNVDYVAADPDAVSLTVSVAGAGSQGNVQYDSLATGTLTINAVTVANSGSLTISQAGPITVAGNISTADGSISLTTTDGAVNVNQSIAAGDSGTSGDDTVTITSADANQNDGTGASQFVLANNANVTTANGAGIAITADRMTINTIGTSISAGTGIVLLRQQATTATNANASVDVGGADSFNGATNPDTVVLGLTDGELDRVTAGTLRVGRADGGPVGISAAIDTANTANLSLLSAGTVAESAGGTITEGSLSVTAGGAVTLAQANSVTNVAIDTATGNVQFTNSNAFNVTTVDGVTGIDTDNGTVSLTASNGDVTVVDTAVNNDIEATGLITVSLQSDDAKFTVNANADVETNAGGVTVTADKVDLAGTITATGLVVTLAPDDAGEAIDLGSNVDTTADTLELSDAELDNVTADTLRVGSTASGAITVSSAGLGPDNAATAFSLLSDEGIGASGGGTITFVGALRIDVDTAVDLTGANDVDTLAANVADNGLGLTFVDSDDLTLTTVDGLDGVTTNNGAIAITTTDGGLTVADTGAAIDVGAGASTIALTAGTTGTTARSLTINPSARVVVTNDEITLTANNMSLDQAEVFGDGIFEVDAGAGGEVKIRPAVAGTVFQVGGTATDADGSPDTLGINNAELGNIRGDLDLASAGTGNFEITGAISPSAGSTVKISTGGSIVDNNASNPDVTVTNLVLSAATGIGSGSDASGPSGFLDIDVTNLDVTNSTSGSVQIVNNGSLTLLDLDATSPAVIRGGGEIRADSPLNINTAQNVAGNFTFSAGDDTATAGDNITIAANVTHLDGNGYIAFVAGDDISHTSGAIQNTGGSVNEIRMTADNEASGADAGDRGSIIQGGGTISAGNLVFRAHENITYVQPGNDAGVLAASVSGTGFTASFRDTSALQVGTVNSINGVQNASGPVNLTAAGHLTSTTVDATADVVGTTLTLVVTGAGNDIGSGTASPLEIDATTLNASTAGAAGDDIFVDDLAGGLAAGLITAGAGDVDIDVVSGSLTNVTSDATADIVGDTVTLDVTGAGNAIGVSTASLDVDATTLNASTNGAAGDDMFIDDEAGGVAIGVVNAGAGGDAFLTAMGGAITDANGVANNITAADLVLRAASGIGQTADELETIVTRLEADGGTGGVFVVNTGALTIGGISGMTGVSATGGDIRVTASSPLTVNENVIESGGDDITLTATNDGGNDDHLTINALVQASGGNGNIVLNAGTDLIVNTGGLNEASVAGAGTITANVGRETQLNANVEVISAGGTITFNTDEMVINAGSATVNSAAGRTIIRPTTGGGTVAIDLGSNPVTANVLELSDAELDRITAGTLEIGDSAAGAVSVTAALTPGGTTTLHVLSGNSVSQTAGSTITETSLGVTAGGAVTLIEANDADNLSIDTSTGNVQFTDSDGFNVTTVDGVTGVDTDSGTVSLIATTGNMTVANTAAANDIDATGLITVSLLGDDAIFTVNGTADVETTAGGITVTADKMDLAGTVTATAQVVTLQPDEANEAIDLGSATNAAADTLELSDAELDNVTAGTLRIGSTGAGAISVTAAISPASTPTLHLRTGITASQNAGSTVTATSLAITAGGAVTLAQANDVDNVAIDTSTGNVQFTDSDGFDVTTVDSVTGIDTDNGTVTLIATTGNVSVANAAVGSDIDATGLITLTLQGDDATFAVSGSADVQTTAGGAIVTADKMNVVGTITATGQVVTLQPNEANEAIELGSTTDAAGDTLELSDAELDNVTADTLRVGSAGAGSISVTAAMSPAATTTLHLTSGDSVSETAGSTITVADLAVTAGGTVTLAQANDADNVAIDTSTGNVQFADSDGFSVTTVDSVTGIDTDNGTVTLTSTTGNVTVVNDVEATGLVTITLQGDDATLAVNGGVDVETTSGGVTVTADKMNLTGTITATSQIVTLEPNEANEAIDLGSAVDTTADTLELSDAELDNVTATTLRVGSTTAGAISVTQASTPAAVTNLALLSGAGVSQTAGSTITVAGLRIDVDETANLSEANDVDSFAAAIEDTSQSLTFVDVDDLRIDTVDTTVGATLIDATDGNSGGQITIRSGDALTVDQAVANHDGGNTTLASEGAAVTRDLDLNANVTATGGSGNIGLYAGDSIDVDASVTISAAGSGTVLASAGTDFNNGATGNGTASGNVVMGDGSTIQSADGNLTVRAPGNVQLSMVNANSNVDASRGDVIVTADYDGDGAGPLSDGIGAISDNLTGEAANVTGDQTALRAASGVGDGEASNAADIDMAANSLAAVTDSGDIHVQNSGALTINTFDGLSGVTITDSANDNSGLDHITIRTTSPLTVDAGDPVVNNDGGNITLAAEGSAAADDLTVNANVTTADGNGNVRLYAGDTIDLAAGAVIVSAVGSGDVLLSAGTDFNDNTIPLRDGNSEGDVLMTSGAAVNAEDGNITLLAPDDIQLSIVNANSDIDAAVGDVIITADYAGPDSTGASLYASNNDGAISDTLASENANVTGDELAMRAGTGIGDGEASNTADIDTAVNVLAAVTDSGDIHLQNSGALTVNTFDGLSGVTITDTADDNSGGDHITIRTTSPLTIDADDPVVNNDAGNVTLAAEGNAATDDLTINANVTSAGGSGNVNLYAGDTVDLGLATVVVSTTGSGGVLLSAGTDFNDNSSPLADGNSEGDVLMTGGATVSSADGNITLLAPDDIQLSVVNANSNSDATLGDVIVTADYAGPDGTGSSLYGGNNDGAISDNLAAETANITGDETALRAGTGIGDGEASNAADIDMAVNVLTAVTDSGDIHLQNNGALTIDTFDGLSGVTITDTGDDNSGADHITIRASSPLASAAGNPVANNDGGNITLAAEGNAPADDLTLNDNVTTLGGNGNVNLYAGDTVSLAQSTVVVSAVGNGEVLLSAGTDFNDGAPQNGTAGGDIVMQDGSTISTEDDDVDADGDIMLRAPGNVQVSVLNANSDGDATLGDVFVTADYDGASGGLSDNNGAITDNLTAVLVAGGEAVNITSDEAVLRAGTGVANDSQDLDTQVGTLAGVTNTGDFNVEDAAGGLTIATVDGTSGVTIANGGAADNVVLSASVGDLTINASVTTTGNGTITGRAGGNLQLDPGAAVVIETATGRISTLTPLVTITPHQFRPNEEVDVGNIVSTATMDQVIVGDIQGTNYRLDADWGVSGDPSQNLVYQVVDVVTGELAPSAVPTSQIDATTVHTVTHEYPTLLLQLRPDTSADILAVFTFSFDYRGGAPGDDFVNNGIQLFENTTQPVVVRVIVAETVRLRLPNVGAPQFLQTPREEAKVEVSVPETRTVSKTSSTETPGFELISPLPGAAIDPQDHLELFRVTVQGEEISVKSWDDGDASALDDLPGLFGGLDNDHYRLYLMRDARKLVPFFDVLVKDGIPLPPPDTAQSQAADAAQNVLADGPGDNVDLESQADDASSVGLSHGPADLPAGSNRPIDSPDGSDVSDQNGPANEQVVAAAVGAAALAGGLQRSWETRVDRAMKNMGNRSLNKISRLCRRWK